MLFHPGECSSTSRVLLRDCEIFAKLRLYVAVSNQHEHGRYEVRLMDPVQGEVTRSYILHLPASYNPANTAATPLLLDYHGYTASANLQLLLFPWRQVADRDETGGVLSYLIVLSSFPRVRVYLRGHGWDVGRAGGRLQA